LKNRFNRTQNWLNRFLHYSLCQLSDLSVCQSVLSEKVVCRLLENRFNRFLGRFNQIWNRSTLRLSQSVNRDPLWWKPVQPVQPVFSQISPTTTSFWGLLYIPLTLSLFIHFCPLHEFLAGQLSNKSIQSTSHTQIRISFN
jgi:hypothetical protein